MENLFSCLYAGPLSASAQRIVTALRAEYADRVDRSHIYLQRRPVNPFQSQNTWSQTQNNHSSSSRSWPRPYSSFTGTQGESQTPGFTATERDSPPSHATPLPVWMESAEREPSFTPERESPLSPLPFNSSQTEFSLRLDSPHYEPSFHFQPVKRSSGFFHSPQKDRPFPLPSPQRGSPFSSVFPPKEPPRTPPSMGTNLLGFTGPAAAPRGVVRRLRMPPQQDRADNLQSHPEDRSDQARQPMILETHARLESHQSGMHMHHTRPETNHTGPHIHQMGPENHCKETSPWAKPATHTRLDNHQVDPDFCHTKCDINQAGPDDLHTEPASHKTQASSKAFTAGSELSDLQKEDKHDPPATSPVITVPQIPIGRSRRQGWALSVMPRREASEMGEQTENDPSPADPAKKWEFGRLLVPAHRSPMNTETEIVSSQFDRQSAGPMREASREMEVDFGHSSDRGGAQEDVLPLGGARDDRETMTPSKRGCDLGSLYEKNLIQVPVPCSRSSSVEETNGGHENTSAQARDLDTQMETETEPHPESQLPSIPSGSDSAEAPSGFEQAEHAHTLSSSDMPRHGNQHESETDDRCDHDNQSHHGEHNDQGKKYEENAWFDRETSMTEDNTLQALTHADIPTAEQSHPEQKRQKISLTEGGTGKKPKKFPEVERFTESPAVDTARSEGRGPQRRLGMSSRMLGFKAPPAVRTPLHPSQPSPQARPLQPSQPSPQARPLQPSQPSPQARPLQPSQPSPQVVSGSSSGLSPNRSSGLPKRHLMTPIAKGLVESPMIASSLSPTPRAHPTPLSERTPSTSSQQPPLPRRPVRWEPPRSSQGTPCSRGETDNFSHQTETTPRSCPRPQASTSVTPKTKTTEPQSTTQPRSKTPHSHLPPVPQRPPPLGSHQQSPAPGELPVVDKDESSGHGCRKRPRSITREPPISHQPAPRATNQKQAGTAPERRQPGLTGKAREEAEMATTKPKPNPLTSDPRVCDAGQLSAREREGVLGEVKMARALVLTLVFQDGSTQLDLEQKNTPSVCGILILLKRALDMSRPQQPEEEKLLFLRLEQRPAWVKQQPDHSHEQFTRELVLLVLSEHRQVVCYKAKDLMRTILQHHTRMLNWKQMGVCEVLDPQIAAWLLDPADSATCFQELLSKHSKTNTHSSSSSSNTHSFTLALGPQKVTQLMLGLNQLYKLMVDLRSALQTKGLWQLYSQMEIRMIPVLAAMESHRIHVDRDALKKTSEMLGSKLKQLEQEAHQAAGQQFLVSSNNQLRLVLFEKLRLHERCENKKLPKTLLKQQQSTSEAVLLQLQDLHPLPKIILAYRQVHKIKSAFVDGILSCVNKMFISSTWNQTSAVSGRLSAKHPNFQALPKQPLQITKTQYVHGKEAELVTVHPRTMFIPRQGWTFLSADFCQVELRLLAHLSSDPELLRIFQNPDADVFTMLASQWKGIKEDSVSSEDREHAKRVVYSVVYGAGRERLSGILGVSAEQASHFQDSFLQTYREVQTFIQSTIQQCQNQGYVVSIMGRRRSLPYIHSADWGARMQAERQAVNFVVQGSAADLCKMAMIRIFSQVTSSASLTARLVAQIHDELLFEVEAQQLQEFALLVKSTMESLQHIDNLGVNLTVPLKVAVSSGSSWGSMSELCLPHTSPSV